MPRRGALLFLAAAARAQDDRAGAPAAAAAPARRRCDRFPLAAASTRLRPVSPRTRLRNCALPCRTATSNAPPTDALQCRDDRPGGITPRTAPADAVGSGRRPLQHSRCCCSRARAEVQPRCRPRRPPARACARPGDSRCAAWTPHGGSSRQPPAALAWHRSGRGGEAPGVDEAFELKVKSLEENVNELKEKIFRTKARLLAVARDGARRRHHRGREGGAASIATRWAASSCSKRTATRSTARRTLPASTTKATSTRSSISRSTTAG